MKKTINRIIAVALLSTLMAFTYGTGSKERATFTVYGKCDMCEDRIEDGLNKIDGIIWADWEIETQELTVKYDADKITLDEIKKKVAEIGHDTDDVRATEEAYNNLHHCCKYERPKK